MAKVKVKMVGGPIEFEITNMQSCEPDSFAEEELEKVRKLAAGGEASIAKLGRLLKHESLTIQQTALDALKQLSEKGVDILPVFSIAGRAG